MAKTEKFTKKVIYGGSSKIVIEGEPFGNCKELVPEDGEKNEKMAFKAGEVDLGEFVLKNWNAFAFKNKSIKVNRKHGKKAYRQLKRKLRNELAAGGVMTRKKEYLLIKRNGIWEFPKGKLEKGEGWKRAAKREIFEETGAVGRITNLIQTTFHIYKRNDIINLKRTRWYAMKAKGEFNLQPQEKEGITNVGFFPKETVERLLIGSYENVVRVWESYKNFQSL
jgi:ADP-ribose pyrophosphatase YjhB (NUDIX family)